MIRVDLEFVPTRRPVETVVVFDVLRMTTTACALFARGLEELVVVADADEAAAVARARGALLLGERAGVPPAGFDGGNSPVESLRLDVAGRRAVACTTNGSKAVEAAAGARHLLLGAIVNADAVARFLLALGVDEVRLSCAGTDGAASLDDVLGAACVLRALEAHGAALEPSDAARLALHLLDGRDDPRPLLDEAAHARFLRSIGFGDDVDLAARRGAFDVVPWRHAAAPPAFVVGRPG
jgi:2-phosphosulfolactate phosphatase